MTKILEENAAIINRRCGRGNFMERNEWIGRLTSRQSDMMSAVSQFRMQKTSNEKDVPINSNIANGRVPSPSC